MHSNKQNPVEVIGAGDIGAGVGFKDIHTGDTLCDETAPIVLESMDFPEPVIGIAVEPKTQKDMDKLSNGLAKLAEEDPTFTVKTDEQSGQTIISNTIGASSSHNVSPVRISLKPTPAPISPAPITSTGFCLFECIWNKRDTRSFLPERVL